MEYVTWSDFFQSIIAFSTFGSMIIALIALIYTVINKKK